VDCEKFDRIVLDLLYDELDELTSAAAKRHMEHCARCRAIGSGLRATREVGAMPLVEVPDGLELRILAAERRATELLPLGKRLGRGLSLLAGYAMRPQLAMAALLMLMIGSSLLFLRGQPGDREHVLVTERGVPESDNDPVAVVAKKDDGPSGDLKLGGARPRADESSTRRERATNEGKAEAHAASPAPAAAAPNVAARGGDLDALSDKAEGALEEAPTDAETSYDAAMSAYRDGRYSEAQRRFAELASRGGEHAPSAALYEVQALRMVSGCPAAAPRFEDVHSRYPGSIGSDAAWQAADCYRSLGELTRARQNYNELLTDANYKTRAQDALSELDLQGQEVAARKSAGVGAGAGTSGAKGKAAAAAARPPAATAPAAKP